MLGVWVTVAGLAAWTQARPAHAFKVETHVWIAQQVLNDLADDGKLTTPFDIDAFKNLLARLLSLGVSSEKSLAADGFESVFFRPLLEEICAKLKAVEAEFNAKLSITRRR